MISRIPRLADHTILSPLPLKHDLMGVEKMLQAGKMRAHQEWVEELFVGLQHQNAPVNEGDMIIRHSKATKAARKDLQGKANIDENVRLHYAAPVGGFYHNHVSRLMVRCGIEDRLDRIPLTVLMNIEGA